MDKQQVIETYIEKNNKKSILGFLGINKMLGIDKAITQYLNGELNPDIKSTESFGDFIKSSILINFFLKNKKNELDKLKEYLDLNKENKNQLENLANEIKKGTKIENALEQAKSTPVKNPVTAPTTNLPKTENTPITTNSNPQTPTTVDRPEIDKNPTDKYIKNVIKSAEEKIGNSYKWGGVGPDKFDCSGLRYRAFKNEGIDFPQRFTAEYFDKKDLNINQDNTQIGDFMYREEAPGQKKHNDIYHIEMVVEKPFRKNGKWFVKTIGSSTDEGVLDNNGDPTKKDGVGYRLREITEYRHFGRPSYYQQLAQYDKTGDESKLLA